MHGPEHVVPRPASLEPQTANLPIEQRDQGAAGSMADSWSSSGAMKSVWERQRREVRHNCEWKLSQKPKDETESCSWYS